jgi:predicted HTH transcriptional regulator
MTFDLHTLDDLNRLGETFELDCKLALGQNGPARLEMSWARPLAACAVASEETSEETAQRILGLLRQSPARSARQLASQLSLSQRAVELHLAKLKAANKLRRVGPNKGGRWEVLT